MRTWNWVLNLGYQMATYPCSARVETERPKGFVAHWLPGTNPQLKEFASKRKLPADASRGGAATMYPDYELELEKAGAKQGAPRVRASRLQPQLRKLHLRRRPRRSTSSRYKGASICWRVAHAMSPCRSAMAAGSYWSRPR